MRLHESLMIAGILALAGGGAAQQRPASQPAAAASKPAASQPAAKAEPVMLVNEQGELYQPNTAKATGANVGGVPLDSDEGRALLGQDPGPDYEALRANWIAQYDSHCGAATAVVACNSLESTLGLTQNNLFTDEVKEIITQDVVYRIGFTLEELEDTIETRTGLEAERFHAGDGEGHHGLEAFVAALEADAASPGNRLLLNFSGNTLRGQGNELGGHFSPIAAYNAEAGMALILDVNEHRPFCWVPVENIYGALATTDPISKQKRGWIVVSAAE